MEYSATDGSGKVSKQKTSEQSAANKAAHDLAMDRHKASEQFEQDERQLCVEDSLFCDKPGSQWDEIASRGRKRAKRPMYEINRVAAARNQFLGDQLQNRVEIRVRPKGGGAKQDIAEIYEGVVRSIRDNSGDSWKDNGLKEMATGGIGAWEVCTRYTVDDGWDQEIYLKPIRSAATTVSVDPESVEDCHKDAKWISVVKNWSPESFQKRWPLSKAANFNLIGINGVRSGWRTQDFIKVADYYVKEPTKKTLVLMTNGQTYEKNEDFEKIEDELAQNGITQSQIKVVSSHKVLHYKLSGGEVLDGPHEIPGMELPIVLGYGYSSWIDGVHYYCGMIRKAKDPQRVYNYETSSSVETGALAPKDPYWVSTKQAEGYEGDLARMATDNAPVQFFNPDPENAGPPRRTGAPAVQAAQINRIRQAESDIMSATGYHAPSLGDNPRDQSGIALKTQQRQGFNGTYEITDNHAKMIEHTGRIIIGMIPPIYDGTRIERILKEDGDVDLVQINQVVIDEQTGEEVVLNDLSVGKYDMKVDVGPSFATKREEAVAYLTEAGRTSPIIGQTTTDLVLKNMDFPGSKEASARARKLGIKEGYIDPTPEEEEEMKSKQKPDPIQELNFEMMVASLEERVAKIDQIELESEKIRSETAENWAQVQETIEGQELRTLKSQTAAEQALEQVNKTIMDGKRADAKEAREDQMHQQQAQAQQQQQGQSTQPQPQQ